MKISRDNYEIYFIDYFDGKLAAEDVAELFLFLATVPDLKIEFENFTNLKLDSIHDENAFPGREILKRGSVTAGNYQWYLAASLEGDLSMNEEDELKRFVASHPGAEHQQKLYALTVLNKDEKEIFDAKASLKQPVPLSIERRRTISWSIAAMLLLGIIASSLFFFMQAERTVDPRIAVVPKNEPVPVSPVESAEPAPLVAQHTDEVPAKIKKVKPRPSVVIPSEAPVTAGKITDKSNDPVDPLQPIHDAVIMQHPLAQEMADRKNMLNTQPAGAQVSEEKYMTVWEAIRSASVNKIKEGNSRETALASLDNNENVSLIDVVGKGLNMLSKDKVKLDSNYDEIEHKSSFRFSVGKLKIEKN